MIELSTVEVLIDSLWRGQPLRQSGKYAKRGGKHNATWYRKNVLGLPPKPKVQK